MPAAIERKRRTPNVQYRMQRPTKRSFEDKCVPKLELGNEGRQSQEPVLASLAEVRDPSTSLRMTGENSCKRFGLARRIDIVLRSGDQEKGNRYGRKTEVGKMGWATVAGRRRRTGQRQPAVRQQRSRRPQPPICGDLFQVRRAIVHRRGLEMVHVLEM